MAKLFVDNGANLTAAMRKRYDIGLISLATIWGGIVRFGDEITAAQVIEAQRNGEKVTTSAPSLGEVKQVLEEAIREGHKEIIVITLPAHSSKTFEVITQAASELMEAHKGIRIEVVDGYNVSMAQGFLALKVAELLEQGARFDFVADRARGLRWNNLLIVALATPKFAGEGGRVQALKAMIGSLIKLRPTVVVLPNKKPCTFGSKMTRTTRDAMQRIIDRTKELWRPGARVAVVYAPDVEERAKRLVETLRTELCISENEETPLVEAAAPLLVHAGYGAIGIALAFDEPVKWV